MEIEIDRLHSAAYHMLPVCLATTVLKIGWMARHVPIRHASMIGMTYRIRLIMYFSICPPFSGTGMYSAYPFRQNELQAGKEYCFVFLKRI